MIRPIIYLIKEVDDDGDDTFNHKKKTIVTKYYNARVTSLHGAMAQNNAMGQRFDKSWVIRFNDLETADYIGFDGEYDTKTNKPKYKVNQEVHHRYRTDLYVVGTVVKP